MFIKNKKKIFFEEKKAIQAIEFIETLSGEHKKKSDQLTLEGHDR